MLLEKTRFNDLICSQKTATWSPIRKYAAREYGLSCQETQKGEMRFGVAQRARAQRERLPADRPEDLRKGSRSAA